MKIEYKVGNLINAIEPAIAHGANARGVMGSGVALAIKENFPEAYKEYRDLYVSRKESAGQNEAYSFEELQTLPLGLNIYAKSKDKLIVNCITQKDYGKNQKQYVSYDAIQRCMRDMNTYLSQRKIEAVAMPLIGAGLGGGDWEIISRIIEKETINIQPVVYTLEKIELPL